MPWLLFISSSTHFNYLQFLPSVEYRLNSRKHAIVYEKSNVKSVYSQNQQHAYQYGQHIADRVKKRLPAGHPNADPFILNNLKIKRNPVLFLNIFHSFITDQTMSVVNKQALKPADPAHFSQNKKIRRIRLNAPDFEK